MAKSQAKIGYGTLIKYETAAGSGVYTTVAEVTNITGIPALEADEIEVTHMESLNRTREYIAGLLTPGTLDFTINWIISNSTHDEATGLRAMLKSGEIRGWMVDFTASFAVVVQGDGFVKSFKPDAPVDGKIGATVSVKQAGDWVEV